MALEDIINQIKKWLRTNIFKPAELLKKMYLQGGTLNTEVSFGI